MTTIRKTYSVARFKALPDISGQPTGQFEALVSVFNNVDLQGDRVMPHAFDATLKAWEESGDPIPCCWSHDWADPYAHIGYVNPSDCEVTPEGLLVRGQIDVGTNPFAAQVYSLMKQRRVKEFSFAYEVVHEAKDKNDGANNLEELNLIEVGPTLKGANPATELVGVKASLEAAAVEQREKERYEAAILARILQEKVLRDTLEEMSDVETKQVDNTEWDGPAAMSRCAESDDPAAAYNAICAGKREGDPALQSSHALPHHKNPDDPPNADGVRNSLSRLPQTEGLTNAEAAQAHLDAHMRVISPESASIESDETKSATKPWHIEERDGQFCVVKDPSETLKCYDTREEADAYMRALWAREPKDIGAKAGRVLSAKNESKIRQAAGLLTEVLQTIGDATPPEGASAPTVGEKEPSGAITEEPRTDDDLRLKTLLADLSA